VRYTLQEQKFQRKSNRAKVP